MTSTPLIELKDVSRWYGEVIGVNRVTVTLRPGITGLLGPNGSGKSTLMNLITGMLQPSHGEVLLFGEPAWANLSTARRLGYCAQSDAFYENMTGLTFIESLLSLRGWSRTRSRNAAMHALERLGMTPNMNRKIRSYSKGMRQRTKVALAIAHAPEVVVLDEPLNGLDAVGRHEMIELVRSFGQEGRNVVISSHVLHEIGAMTNNILMMSGGYLLAEGDVREVRQGLRAHPHKVLVRCGNPREAAMAFLRDAHTLSAQIEEADSAVLVQTRDLEAFQAVLQSYVLDQGANVSLVTVADENVTSIFGYLAAGGSRGGN
jgi:ABC-2 type transport system ATP-binding protein